MNKKYAGMTVNERLFVSGYYDEFYEAVKEKNIQRVIAILKEVDLENETLINPILVQFGLLPKQG